MSGVRVIAGEARGRRLRTPEGLATRPMLERQRQALFDILAPRIAGAVVLDLFAGSGALGIEALSRGAERAVFVENGRHALPVLRANIETCRYGDRAQVLRADALGLDPSRLPGPFDLVFLDPPFPLLEPGPERIEGLLDVLARSPALAPGCLCVLRTPAGGPDLSPAWGSRRRDLRRMGESSLHLLEPRG